MTLARTFLLPLLLLTGRVASAQPPLPPEQWTPPARLDLARAMVGEADFHRTEDHIAIAWVLAKRWKHARLRFPRWRFHDQVRKFASPLKVDSPRARWVRALPWGPLSGVLKRYTKRWFSVMNLVVDWGLGNIRDPCRSAISWGGTMDPPGERLRPVDCGRTANTFYALRRRKAQP